ncbi:MAG: 3-isopropylmalate dehydratase small subunit [Opitutales bacterium]|nr:3-isopropylmalate dehydratase small subunit [Opitutales bacterium]
MALEKIYSVKAVPVVVPGDDIDTDRIIPARFLKSLTFASLGAHAFHDERFNEDGSLKGHPFDAPAAKGAGILISGMNFGCGSSREHAPQALKHHGIRAIVAGSFAEIFFGNATAIGIACLTASAEDLATLSQWIAAHPGETIEADVQNECVRCGEICVPAHLPASTKTVLLSGHWDPIADLLDNLEQANELSQKLKI